MHTNWVILGSTERPAAQHPIYYLRQNALKPAIKMLILRFSRFYLLPIFLFFSLAGSPLTLDLLSNNKFLLVARLDLCAAQIYGLRFTAKRRYRRSPLLEPAFSTNINWQL